MKKKMIISLTVVLALVLSVTTTSLVFASAQETKAEQEAGQTKELWVCDGNVCEGAVCDGADNSYEDFIREMKELTEDEKAALLSDLAAIEEIEKQIDDLYTELDDDNFESVYDKIDALDDEIEKLLEKNAALWDKVDEAYDELVAGLEADTPWILNESALPLCG